LRLLCPEVIVSIQGVVRGAQNSVDRIYFGLNKG